MLAEKFDIRKFEVTGGTWTKTPGTGQNTYTPTAAGATCKIIESDGSIQNHTGLGITDKFIVHSDGHVEIE